MSGEANKEMDLLLRRLSRQQDGVSSSAKEGLGGGEHLDADELSAFAENALPASARAQYTEHLADCSRCRTIVSQLSASLSPVVTQRAATPVVEASALKKFLQSLFSPMVLRYAVPAIGLMVIGAIGLIVLRPRYQERYQETSVAERIASPESGRVTKSPEEPSAGLRSDSVNGQISPSPSETFAFDDAEKQKTDASRKPAAEGDVAKKEATAAPASVAANESQPTASAAPPPAPTPATVDSVTESKVAAADAKQQRAAEISARRELAKAPAKVLQDEDRKLENEPAGTRPSGPMKGGGESAAKRRDNATTTGAAAGDAERQREVGRDKDEVRGQEQNKAKTDGAEVRSVAGRRFRRDENRWVDVAYSSQALTNVSRGSEQFRSLIADEPPIRTIADQLSGEVIVVWKGRAYRIR